MSSLYIAARHGVKWQPIPEVTPEPAPKRRRPRLVGTLHVEGWKHQVRAQRAVLGAIYQRAPSCPPKGGHDAVAMRIIENVHLLDNRALNLLDLVFAELAKLSVH